MGPQLGSDRKHLCYVPGKQFKPCILFMS